MEEKVHGNRLETCLPWFFRCLVRYSCIKIKKRLIQSNFSILYFRNLSFLINVQTLIRRIGRNFFRKKTKRTYTTIRVTRVDAWDIMMQQQYTKQYICKLQKQDILHIFTCRCISISIYQSLCYAMLCNSNCITYLNYMGQLIMCVYEQVCYYIYSMYYLHSPI